MRVKCVWVLCRDPRIIYKWRIREIRARIRVIYLRPSHIHWIQNQFEVTWDWRRMCLKYPKVLHSDLPHQWHRPQVMLDQNSFPHTVTRILKLSIRFFSSFDNIDDKVLCPDRWKVGHSKRRICVFKTQSERPKGAKDKVKRPKGPPAGPRLLVIIIILAFYFAAATRVACQLFWFTRFCLLGFTGNELEKAFMLWR